MSTDLILVGDCGGTNSRLRLYSVAPNARVENNLPPGDLVKWSEYQNAEYEGKGGFPAIVRAFMSSSPAVTETPTAACLAVAGPVESNRVVFTNRNWVIDGADLEKTLGIQRVRLVNDFVANGYGLLTLDHEKECVCLQRAPHVAGAPIACIGAGTGLGECFSTATEVGKEYDTYASEGGHAEFAPRNDLETELLTFLKKKFAQRNRVSVERVVSGTGLANVYEFLSTKYKSKVIKAVHDEFLAAGDMRGKVIAMHSRKDGAAPYCGLCAQTMQIFAAAYGSEAGVLGLKFIPLNGLYVAGGLTPKNIELLRGGGDASPFMQAFHDKGRVSPLLKKIPLYAVMAEDIGQRGAHLVAFKQLEICRLHSSSSAPPRARKPLFRSTTSFGMGFMGSAAAHESHHEEWHRGWWREPTAWAAAAAVAGVSFAVGLAAAKKGRA